MLVGEAVLLIFCTPVVEESVEFDDVVTVSDDGPLERMGLPSG